MFVRTIDNNNNIAVYTLDKERIPAEPFTGYVRIGGRRARKEREGRLATSLPTATHNVAAASYADATK
jgi:hypothetical protein